MQSSILTELCSIIEFSLFEVIYLTFINAFFPQNCWVITGFCFFFFNVYIFEGLLLDRLLTMNQLAWEKQHAGSVPGGHAAWLMKQCKNPGKGKALSHLTCVVALIPFSISLLPGLSSKSARLESSLSLFNTNLFWLEY